MTGLQCVKSYWNDMLMLNPLESVIEGINTNRERLGFLIQKQLEYRNTKNSKEREKYPEEYPFLSFSVTEMLDSPYSKNFKRSMAELYPLSEFTREEEDELEAKGVQVGCRCWWEVVVSYFIETNQFEKYKCATTLVSQCDRDTANYALMIHLVSKYKPIDPRFFAHTLFAFCFYCTPNGSFDPTEIDTKILDNPEFDELKKWIFQYKILNLKTGIITIPRLELCIQPPELGSEKYEDWYDNCDEIWEEWYEETEESLKSILTKYGL